MKLYCNSIKCEGFSNPTKQKDWYRMIDTVKTWQKEFGFEDGVRDLFYELLQQGFCHTVAVDRIPTVEKVLKAKGYKVDKIVK